ncbi:hypothetical protein D3C87_1626690 [compost metagenome]
MLVPGLDRGQHPLSRCPLYRTAQRDVGGNVNDVEPLRGQQHEGAFRLRQIGQQPGMTVVMMAGEVHRLLVDWRGNDAIRPAAHGHLDRPRDVAHRGLTGDGADLADLRQRRVERHLFHHDGSIPWACGYFER